MAETSRHSWSPRCDADRHAPVAVEDRVDVTLTGGVEFEDLRRPIPIAEITTLR